MNLITHALRWLPYICLLSSFQTLGDSNTVYPPKPAFELIVLGDSGGIQDGNLSAFLLRSASNPNYVALDAGTLVNGINRALAQGAFSRLNPQASSQWRVAGNVLREHVKGYLISHAHLDHINGLLVASPEDSKKNIYALASVNQMVGETYFNGKAWANFSDRGIPPTLNKYHMIDLPVGEKVTLEATDLVVTAFSLSHPVESAAFVIEHGKDMFVYFGDTGADSIEKQGKLDTIWRFLASQMAEKTLRGIIIETSFENERPHNLLFGHLTPELLMQELVNFTAKLPAGKSLYGLKVVISHIKYTLANGVNPRENIRRQLDKANTVGIEIIVPEQGQILLF